MPAYSITRLLLALLLWLVVLYMIWKTFQRRRQADQRVQRQERIPEKTPELRVHGGAPAPERPAEHAEVGYGHDPHDRELMRDDRVLARQGDGQAVVHIRARRADPGVRVQDDRLPTWSRSHRLALGLPIPEK